MLAGLGEGSFAAEGGRSADLAQTDMAFKVAVPLLPGDEANFVTGLAIDYSNAVRSMRAACLVCMCVFCVCVRSILCVLCACEPCLFLWFGEESCDTAAQEVTQAGSGSWLGEGGT